MGESPFIASDPVRAADGMCDQDINSIQTMASDKDKHAAKIHQRFSAVPSFHLLGQAFSHEKYFVVMLTIVPDCL